MIANTMYGINNIKFLNKICVRPEHRACLRVEHPSLESLLTTIVNVSPTVIYLCVCVCVCVYIYIYIYTRYVISNYIYIYI